MLMHQLLRDGADRSPDKIVLRWVDRNKALTFTDAVAEMERFAGALNHLDGKKGDRVTVFAHNGIDHLMALFACWRTGAIPALVNVRFADDLEYCFEDQQPTVVIYTHDQVAAVVTGTNVTVLSAARSAAASGHRGLRLRGLPAWCQAIRASGR